MDELDSIFKTTLSELERMLTTKTVVGEPIQVGGNTIVPLVAVGFGFGGGGGSGEQAKTTNAKGSGVGAGVGGGVRPVAVVIIDKDGHARVEPVRATASVIEKFGEAVARVIQSRAKKGTPAEE